MKILVPVKRVIDYNVKPRVKADGSGVDLANVKMSMNPFDEIAVEEAIRLKEKGVGSEIVVVSIGPAKAQETLRTALAMGADRAILIQTDDEVEPLGVAKLLAKVQEEEAAGLIILGKQAIDDDSNQTGQMLAALLGWSQGTFANKLNVADGSVEVKREVDGGLGESIGGAGDLDLGGDPLRARHRRRVVARDSAQPQHYRTERQGFRFRPRLWPSVPGWRSGDGELQSIRVRRVPVFFRELSLGRPRAGFPRALRAVRCGTSLLRRHACAGPILCLSPVSMGGA